MESSHRSNEGPDARRRRDGELEELLVANFARLLARVRMVLGPRSRRAADSVDHLQEVFVEVLRDSQRFNIRDEEHLVRHVAAIARNNIRDAARRQREQGFQSVAMSWLDPTACDDGTSPQSHIGRREQNALLAHALHNLSGEDRRIVQMRGLEHKRFAEIALVLGRNEDTVRKAYNRALLVLSRKLT